jgi:hypothetical protein
MYKTASAKAQGALNAGTVRGEMAAGGAQLSKTEQEANLRRALSLVEVDILKLAKNSPHRAALAKRKTELQTQMTLLRTGKPHGPSIDFTAIQCVFRLKVEAILGVERVAELMVDSKIEWATDHGIALEHVLSDRQMVALKEELGVTA